jgi:hypothetical protein
MSNNILNLNQRSVRGLDSNSLLRLYDQVKEIFTKSPSQQDRLRAGKAVEHIAKELQSRKVRL